MENFTLLFIAVLAAGTLLQLWLSSRQAAHVLAHRDKVPDAFATRVPLDAHRKAASYTLARIGLERWHLAIGAAVLLLWTLGGLLNWLDQLWLMAALPPVWQGVALIFSVMLLGALIELPLSVYSTFVIEAKYGFNHTTPGRFVKDRLLGLLLGVLLGLPLALAVLILMSDAGELWWAWAWLVWMAFTLFVTWAFPVWISPLFNSFEPLADGELRARLEDLLRRCGFRSNGMFVMDGSKRSAHGNAYFTGFGRNKRIVFFDTLLKGLETDEVEAVLAHELGHFKRRHILKMLLLSAATSLAGLALLGWLSAQSWFYSGLGVERQSEALALLLFLLVTPVFTVFLSPLTSALSRRHEYEADDYAAQQTDANALISGLVKMYRENASTLTPDPLYSAFHHSHPPAPLRVANLASKT